MNMHQPVVRRKPVGVPPRLDNRPSPAPVIISDVTPISHNTDPE
jgi:hypothetical protein